MIIALVLGTGWMFLCWALQGYSVVGMDGMRLGAVAPRDLRLGTAEGENMDKVLKCGNPTLIVGNKFGKILGWTSRTQGMRQQKGQLESYIPPSALWALSLIFMRSMLQLPSR